MTGIDHNMRTLPADLALRFTPGDIEGSIPGSTNNCVIARAFTRTLAQKFGEGPTFLRVRYTGITATWRDTVYHYSLPAKAGNLQCLNEANQKSDLYGKSLHVKLRDTPHKAEAPGRQRGSGQSTARGLNPRRQVADAMKPIT